MNFGDTLRAELIEALPRRACCRRSYLHGILINAECGIEGVVMCRIKSDEVAELVKKLLCEQYGREPEVRREVCYGRHISVFEFESRRLAGYLTRFSEPLSESAVSANAAQYPAKSTENIGAGADSTPIPELKCVDCKNAFAAGVLLSAARCSDPQKNVRVEIDINDRVRAEKTAALFAEERSAPGYSERSGRCSLIFKKSAELQDIISSAGAPMAAMELIQGDLLREFRGNINRASNCEVKNISRTVGAASARLEAISALRAAGVFDSLPEELRETALLCESEPECSITELALKHPQRISKSGVNHRLQRIFEAAEKLKK